MPKPTYITEAKWNEEHNHLIGKGSALGNQKANIHDYLYCRLNIIDGKVGSLLTANGIFLAAAGVVGTSFKDNIEPSNLCLLKTSATLWFISTIICLLVSCLKWEYLDAKASNNNAYVDKIISVTVRRTNSYNIALISMFLSFLMFSYVALSHFYI